MPSPVRNSHNEATSLVVWWLVTYTASTPGGRVAARTARAPGFGQRGPPDALLRLVADSRWRYAHMSRGEPYRRPAPELVAGWRSVALRYDVRVKRRIYRRNGVREYLIWRVEDRVIDWFYLTRMTTSPCRLIRKGSCEAAFPGLWLAVQALLEGDLATVLAALQNGLQSAGHIAFVKQLQQELSGGATD